MYCLWFVVGVMTGVCVAGVRALVLMERGEVTGWGRR